MKKLISGMRSLTKFLAMLLLLHSTPAFNAEITVAQSNYLATQNFYNNLIHTSTMPLARLSLFVNQMPKGADLHHHYSGALYAETYLDWVEKKAYCIVTATFEINASPAEVHNKDCISVEQARTNSDFYRQLLMRWSNKDYGNHFHVTPPPDKQFFDTFKYFTSISKAYYEEGLKLLKRRAKDENVQYIETMLARAPAPRKHSDAARLDHLNINTSKEELIAQLANEFAILDADADVQNEIEDFVRQMELVTDGLDDSDFILRVQVYVLRNQNPSVVFSSMYTAFKAAGKSRKIVGINIVGPENEVVAMRDYSLHMQMFKYLKARYPAVSLSLHAGELSLGMVPPEGLRNHIREAIDVAGARRIGHGIDLVYESDASGILKRMVRDRIAVEINLTSNEFIAGVTGSSHPVTIYMQQGVPIVISTDDEGVSRSSMGNEYLLFVSRYKPTYSVLKKTIYNSIEFSFLNAEEKTKQKHLLNQRFANFERKIAHDLQATTSAR